MNMNITNGREDFILNTSRLLYFRKEMKIWHITHGNS